MKIHPVEKKEAVKKGVYIPPLGLCVYQAEPGDLWTGWFAQEAGWSGRGVVIASRVDSYERALDAWIAIHPLSPTTPSLPSTQRVSSASKR